MQDMNMVFNELDWDFEEAFFFILSTPSTGEMLPKILPYSPGVYLTPSDCLLTFLYRFHVINRLHQSIRGFSLFYIP